MSYRKTKVEGVPLTIELARQFANLRPVPGEREIRSARWEYLLKIIKGKKFSGPSWSRGIDKSTGLEYRLDGQHSSRLLASLPADVEFPNDLIVTLDTYEFDSIEEDGADLFNLFNHPRSARTNEDMIGIYTAEEVEFKDIARKAQIKISNGIHEYEAGKKDGFLLDPRKRGLYFKHNPKYRQFACWVYSFDETKNAAFLIRSAIVGEMLTDWMMDAHVADAFWSYVLRENHPDVDHETRTLAEAFRQMSIQKKYSPDEYRKKAKKAWRIYMMEVRAATRPTQESLPDLSEPPKPPDNPSNRPSL